jgi:hypothetical protein
MIALTIHTERLLPELRHAATQMQQRFLPQADKSEMRKTRIENAYFLARMPSIAALTMLICCMPSTDCTIPFAA